MLRSTYTYAVLELSQSAYDEIAGKLRAAGYGGAFHDNGDIDMHGIAIAADRHAGVVGRPLIDVLNEDDEPWGDAVTDPVQAGYCDND